MDRARRSNRGVALIVVLTGITILAAFSSEFTYRSRVDIKIATNLERDVQAYFHARSAVEIVRLVVMSQKMIQPLAAAIPGGKSLELWRYACKFAEVFNTSSVNFFGIEMMNLKGTDGLGVEKGGFNCEIVPEDSKVNLNASGSVADRKGLFTKLYALLAGNVDLEARSGMDRKAAELILNIMDWTDPDDERSDIDSNGNFVQAGGAGENTDYSKWGYKARNARMDSVDEVRLVDGMNDELFCQYGKNFTVYNTDKLNVNEAEPNLLRALVCDNLMPGAQPQACGMGLGQVGVMPMDLAMAMLETCRGIKKMLFMPAFLSESDFLNFWTRLPPDLAQLIPVNAATLRPMVGVRSKVLRVTANGWVNESGHRITAVIDTTSLNWLYWKESGFDANLAQ